MLVITFMEVKMRTTIVLMIEVFVTILLFSVSFGAEYYVDASKGDNANTGLSPDDSFLTITYAMSQVNESTDDLKTIQ